jgi:hypothetical protein
MEKKTRINDCGSKPPTLLHRWGERAKRRPSPGDNSGHQIFSPVPHNQPQKKMIAASILMAAFFKNTAKLVK